MCYTCPAWNTEVRVVAHHLHHTSFGVQTVRFSLNTAKSVDTQYTSSKKVVVSPKKQCSMITQLHGNVEHSRA
jgi:hypothetical protein